MEASPAKKYPYSTPKSDYVAIHAKMVGLALKLEQFGLLPQGALDAYKTLGLRPLHVNATKVNHVRAVMALIDAFEVADFSKVELRQPEPVPMERPVGDATPEPGRDLSALLAGRKIPRRAEPMGVF